VISLSAGPLRLVRAGLVAGTVLGLAVGAHAAGGGVLPGPPVILALGALVLAVTSSLAGRRFTVCVLALVLGGGQLALHGLLTILAPVGRITLGAAGASRASAAHLGHAMPANGASLGPHVTAPATAMAHALMVDSPAMLLAHAVATGVAVLLIASGERAAWWLLVWLRPLAALPARPDDHLTVRHMVLGAPAAAGRLRAMYLCTSPRRGPPRWFASAATLA
jgi:hypothetical protein